MTKLLVFAVLLSIICRWALGKWPWDYLKQQPSRIAQARQLLGVSAAAGPAEIRDAHRRKAALYHPDRGGDAAVLVELNAARDLLLARLPQEGYPPE